MDVSTPPKLRLACPQAKTNLGKQVHMFMEWGVDNKEYGQEASTFYSAEQVTLNSSLYAFYLTWNK